MVSTQNWQTYSVADISWTFAFITVYEDVDRLQEMIENIRSLNIPEYEILFIGGGPNYTPLVYGDPDVRQVWFNEDIKDKWITAKKNLIPYLAKYDNIVIAHDYHLFSDNWYQGFVQFGTDWEICECPQFLITGNRNPMDWSLWDKPGHGRAWSLPYNDWSQTQYMYISGGFFIVKRHVLLEEPFDESRGWNEEEDVEWSMRIRNKYVMKCNGNVAVRHNKWHRHAG